MKTEEKINLYYGVIDAIIDLQEAEFNSTKLELALNELNSKVRDLEQSLTDAQFQPSN